MSQQPAFDAGLEASALPADRQTATAQQVASSSASDSGFLFVDASHNIKNKSAKDSSRHDARAWLMRKARKERPWSTSKRAAGVSKSRTANDATASLPTPHPQSKVVARNPQTSKLTRNAASSGPNPGSSSISSTCVPPARLSSSKIGRQLTAPNQPMTRYLYPRYELQISTQVNRRGECRDCTAARDRGLVYCEPCRYLRSAPRLYSRNVNASGSIDVFSVLPVPFDAKSSQLLIHWQRVVAVAGMPLDDHPESTQFQTMNFDVAKTTAASMHSLLFCSALHSVIANRGSLVDAMYHKTQAVVEVNKSIANSAQGISDGTLYTVFTLLCVEEAMRLSGYKSKFLRSDKAEDDRDIHFLGYRKMIELRGGIGGLRSCRILQCLILWHQTAHALTSFTLPVIDFTAIADEFQIIPIIIKTKMVENIENFLPSHLDISALARDVADLSIILERWFKERPSDLNPAILQNQACIIQLRLIRLAKALDPTTNTYNIARSITLGILGFVSTISDTERRNFHPIEITILDHLKDALSRTRFNDWKPQPEILLWVLNMGALCARQSMLRQWFQARLKTFAQFMGIQTAQAYANCVSSLLWLDRKMERGTFQIWDEAQTTQFSSGLDLDSEETSTAKSNSGANRLFLSLPTIMKDGSSDRSSTEKTQYPTEQDDLEGSQYSADNVPRLIETDLFAHPPGRAGEWRSPTVGDTLVRFHKDFSAHHAEVV